MEEYFKQQDKFLAEMISAYENNLLGKEHEPYFAWKKGLPLFNREQCIAMWQKVREQLDTLYNHTQPEDKLLSYLEAMESELSRIAMYLKYQN